MKEYIDNIDDCKALTFFQICSNEKDFDALRLSGRKSKQKALKAWLNLYNDYLKNFGLPENYAQYLKLMIKANKVWIDVTVNKKKSRRRKAQLIESEALQLINDENKSNSNEIGVICAKLSKYLGFHVDATQISVRQFYSYLKMLNDG